MSLYLTVKNAAMRVNRTTRTIESWINDGPEESRLPVIRIGRKRYVDETKLLAMHKAKREANPVWQQSPEAAEYRAMQAEVDRQRHRKPSTSTS
jgi:transposase